MVHSSRNVFRPKSGKTPFWEPKQVLPDGQLSSCAKPEDLKLLRVHQGDIPGKSFLDGTIQHVLRSVGGTSVYLGTGYNMVTVLEKARTRPCWRWERSHQAREQITAAFGKCFEKL